MRSAAAQSLPIRPTEQELKNAISNSIAGHNHVSSRPAQPRAKSTSDTVHCGSLHHHGHNRENADKCDTAEGPWNLNNPVKASRSHQELHKELLLAHRKGLVVCAKPELQMVLERRKREKTQKEEGEQSRSPLEQVLLQRQQKHQEMMVSSLLNKEKEEEQKVREEVQLLEFVRVRQNLKKVHTALQKNIHS
ncbi:actin-associated protein FAM107A isoform X1 [Danio rerio]|uniref:Actin-associated protein FAM107A isoform X1 n=1 Tax=Danio rerio TaxID=7955 RepID=A0A8M3AVE8_DANRE|nr:protein FAM107B isoform X1 [Danio rerio]|eukprot:XP_009302419.1 protein FAM107B isoform X1 [Danio rerio]